MDWESVIYFFIIPLIVFLILRYVFDNYAEPKETKKMKDEENKVKMNSQNVGESTEPETMKLLTETLRKLNLDVELEDNDVIRTRYQGENYRIIIQSKLFIEIQDPFWYKAPLEDIDNLSVIHKAINNCNMFGMCKIVYTHQEDKTINLHTLVQITFIPEIPDIDKYLGSMMIYMLEYKKMFYNEMEDIRKNQYTMQS